MWQDGLGMVQYIVQDPRLGKEPLVKHTTLGEMDEKGCPSSLKHFLGWKAPGHTGSFWAGEPQLTRHFFWLESPSSLMNSGLDSPTILF